MKNGSCPSGVNAASCSHSTRTGPKKLSRSTPPSRSFATTNDCSPGGWAEKLEESRVMPMIMRDSPQTQKPETAEFRFMDRLGAGAVNVRRKRVLDPIRKRSAVFGVIAAVDHERMVFRAPHNRLAARERTVNELDHLIELHIHHPRLGTRVRVVRRAPTLDAVARKVEFDPALFAEHGAGQLGRAQRVAVEMGGSRLGAEHRFQGLIERLAPVRGISIARKVLLDGAENRVRIEDIVKIVFREQPVLPNEGERFDRARILNRQATRTAIGLNGWIADIRQSARQSALGVRLFRAPHSREAGS